MDFALSCLIPLLTSTLLLSVCSDPTQPEPSLLQVFLMERSHGLRVHSHLLTLIIWLGNVSFHVTAPILVPRSVTLTFQYISFLPYEISLLKTIRDNVLYQIGTLQTFLFFFWPRHTTCGTSVS